MAHHWVTFAVSVVVVIIACVARPQQQQQQQQQHHPQVLYYGDTSPQRYPYYQQQQQSQEPSAPSDAAYLPNINKPPARPSGGSLLGVAYSPASEVSQLTFQGSFANFSY